MSVSFVRRPEPDTFLINKWLMMIDLVVLHGKFTICQLENEMQIPSEVFSSDFFSITKTEDEISIIVRDPVPFPSIKSSNGWRGFKVDGIMDFSLSGIINDITKPLKDNQISVFITSTYNTDYIFVKENSFPKALAILRNTPEMNIREGNETL